MEIVRVVRHESAAAVNSCGTMQGHGAWIYPDLSCLRRTVCLRTFERAFRAVPPDTGAMKELFIPSGGNPSENRDKKAGRNPMDTR